MLFCMRTTLNLDDQLITQAKILAARNGVTLTQVIEDALRVALFRSPEAAPEDPFRIDAARGPRKLRPGVDLYDNAALRDLVDGL